MTRLNQCPLCSSGSINPYLNCNDHLVSGEVYELFKCEACSFVFTQDHPDEKMIIRYYDSEDYASHSDNKSGLMNHIYSAARNIMLHKKLKIIENTSRLKCGRILDIGCGTGFFAAKMKENGWNVTGIEPAVKAREMGITRFGLDILEPEMISSLKEDSFDVITMWHSLEHLHDPHNYSREIQRLLKPDGLLISALPNCDSYDARHYGGLWAAYDVPRHLWHFTPETFSLFAEKNGFRITGIKPLLLDVFYISILSERNKQRSLYLLTGLIKGYLFAARAIFIPGKSSSLIYFLRRK
jgi:2-polyprenyl-3-methyl-5-hydroxy-6-metoxy-1,4-benzoquinol methylase